tara:strand:+ start:1568 stop:2479 length:912 start_codon:yes stop_codon:yes gene_type:complete
VQKSICFVHRIIFCSCILFGFGVAVSSQTNSTTSIKHAKVYAGGVMGISDMLNAKSSDSFRNNEGGLFLHNSGWGNLKVRERRQLINVFKGSPIAIEIGYDRTGKVNWPHWLKGAYIDLGINPHFVTVNAFAERNIPTPSDWKKIHDLLKEVTPKETLILPTFEFANFGKYRNRLVTDRLSNSANFQNIVSTSGGLTLDVPPLVFLSREKEYKEWIIDALKYSRRKGLTSVVIISPNKSGNNFPQHTSTFLQTLARQNALPSVYVVENYVNGPPNYPNRLGNDKNPVTILGLANKLLKSPALK